MKKINYASCKKFTNKYILSTKDCAEYSKFDPELKIPSFITLILLTNLNNTKSLRNNLEKSKIEVIKVFNDFANYIAETKITQRINDGKGDFKKILLINNEFDFFADKIMSVIANNGFLNLVTKEELKKLKNLIDSTCLYFFYNYIDNYFFIEFDKNFTNDYELKIKIATINCRLFEILSKSIRDFFCLESNNVIKIVNIMAKKMYQ